MWVKPPGLMMIPRAVFRCSWTKSMSAPSWFDWNATTCTSQPEHACRTISSISRSVVRP